MNEDQIRVTKFREKRFADKKSSILACALGLIEESGLELLSIRALAQRIEYSPAAIYEYFESKDSLLAAVIAEGHEILAKQMSLARNGSTNREQLKLLGLQYLKFAREHSNLYHLMFNVNKSSRMSFDITPPPESAFGILVSILKSSLPTESLGHHALEQLAFSYWALVHGMASLEISHLKGFEADLKLAQERGIECFLAGLK